MNDEPGFASRAIDPDIFSSQLTKIGDFFPRHPDVRHQVVPATDGDNLRSLRITREQTRGGAHGCMNISGNQRLISSRRAVDSDGLDDQALFLKESLITGHEQRKRDRRKQWDRNAHLLLCRHRSRSEYDNYSEYYRAKQRRDLHPSCPSLLRPAPGKDRDLADKLLFRLSQVRRLRINPA